MFIRRTQTRNTTSGERYYTHRLVESKRVAGQVKQITRLNLGRHFDVNQDHWPALCARIEGVLGGQDTLVPVECPASVERHAQRMAAQLIARGPTSPPVGTSASGAREGHGDIQSVDVDSMALVRPRTVGVESLGL